MRSSIPALATALIAVLTACSVGPRYRPPIVSVPDGFSAAGDSAPSAEAVAATPVDPEFWRSFDDPVLTSLVERALTANNDLRGALARYDRAAALLRNAKLDRFPRGNASEEAGWQVLPKSQTFGYPRDSGFSTTSVRASWELDFFGRIRRGVEAQTQTVLASANDLAVMQVAIVGEVAAAYVDLRERQQRLGIAKRSLGNQREVVRLVEAMLSAGRGTRFDQARVQALLETTSAQIPALRMQIRIDEHRLAVLCGQTPDALISELDVEKALFEIPESIDAGSPAELVRRRPDIAASEQRLHAIVEQVGIVTADLFPRVSLGGVLGLFQFHSGSDFDGASLGASVAPRIDWSFLDRGRVRARIAAARADGETQLAQYQQTVLLALEDVENALAAFHGSRERDLRLQRALKASDEAAELARVRYVNGASGLLEVLDAERELLGAEDAYAESYTNTAVAAVTLYKALAGGWPQRLPEKINLESVAVVDR